MIKRVLIAYGVELVKASRQRFPLLGILAVIAVAAASSLAHPISVDDNGDYAFIAYAAPLAINLLGLIVLLCFSANLISSEFDRGLIRTALVRPLHRREFLVAKLLTGMTYALILALLGAITAWTLVFLFGDMGGVHYGAEVVYSDSAMRTAFLIALGLNVLTLFAAVAYAVFVSVCTRSPATAIGVTISLWLLVDIVKYPLHIAPYVFSTYLDTPWRIFADRCDALDAPWLPSLNHILLASAAWFLLFFSSAIFVMARRNFSS